MTRRALLILLFCSFAVSVSAQTKPKFKPTFRIWVDVSGDNISEAESYLKRELRSLGDVEIVDHFAIPHFTIHAVILRTKNMSGRETGLAISWVTESHLHKLEDKYTGILLDHQLWTTGTESLKRKCEEYIARFDSMALEPMRGGIKEILNGIKGNPSP